jgi:glycosyltransferase involved in cell wall biosynthesis
LKPTVSVIIPVLNNCSQLKESLEALSSQTYPSDKIEIIVIDNGSDEDISECVRDFDVKLLFRTERKSPYAARNTGYAASASEIIAYTDSNKTPSAEWISEGVCALQQNKADLAGGNILFSLSERPTAAEVFDATFFNNNQTLVANETAAVTGNLFIRRHVVEDIGSFPDKFRSGMDVWWTRKAVKKGYKLVFAEQALVMCKPRKFAALMKKSVRVGKSHPFIRKQAGDSILTILGTIIRTFAPPGFFWLRDKTEPIGNYRFSFFFKLWLVSWAYKFCLGYGRIKGLKYLQGV